MSETNEAPGESPAAVISRGLSVLCREDQSVEAILAPRLDGVTAQLAAFIREIEDRNPALGLVGTNDPRELATRHVLDSLAPLGTLSRLLAGFPAAQVADVGSGAGLPGIPLAIVLPDARFTLIERKGRRAGFLRSAVANLGLSNVAVEEQEMEKTAVGRFALVTFRAFRPLEPKIYRGLARLCAKGGSLAAYKGRVARIGEEMAALERTVPSVAGRWEVSPCPVPGLDGERNLVVIAV